MASTLELLVADRLKAVRAELGLDPGGMAKKLSVGRTRYLNWERGDNLPSERAMIVLCDLTGISMDYLYRGRVDVIPTGLAIRLIGWQLGEDPGSPAFPSPQVSRAVMRACRRA